MNRVFIPKRLIVLYRFRFNTWFRSLIFFLVSTTARSRLRRSGEEEVDLSLEEVLEEEEEEVVEVLLVALLANLRLALNSAILACSN